MLFKLCSCLILSLFLNNQGLPKIARPSISRRNQSRKLSLYPSSIFKISPLPIIKVSGEISSLSFIISRISSQCAGTRDISLRVRKCTVKTGNFKVSRFRIQVSISFYYNRCEFSLKLEYSP